MEKHTKIIDLFGLPACGKTSLKEFVCSHYKDQGFVTLGALKREWLKLSVTDKIRYIDLHLLWLAFILYYKSRPISYIISGDCYRWLYSIVLYSYLEKTDYYRFVIVDHGVAQNMISINQSYNYERDKKYILLLKEFLVHQPNRIYVYCEIDIDTAMSRILKRRRINSGRLDAIHDINKLRMAYVKELERFNHLNNLLIDNGCNVAYIKTSYDLSTVANSLILKIENYD